MSEDTRNIIDKYKGYEIEFIREDLSKHKFPYAVAMQHISGDFNISSVWRNANAFGASEIFYIGGPRKIDTRGAVGVNHYSNIKHLKTLEELLALKSHYNFISIENNVDGCVKLNDFIWPADKPPLIIFGEEGKGVLPEILKESIAIVYVEQFGSVRSINVSSCSAIVMNDFVTKFLKKDSNMLMKQRK